MSRAIAINNSKRTKRTRHAVKGRHKSQRSYDAAAPANHFAHASGADANTLIYADLPTLRNRVRYEIRNNCYAKGMSITKADDIVGTGPRLQVESDNEKLAQAIEDAFGRWAATCDMRGKKSLSRLIRLAGSLQQDESGEAFIIMANAGAARRSDREHRLALLLVEADKIATPLEMTGSSGPRLRDGIEYGADGRPTAYFVSKYHPGDAWAAGFGQYDTIPARAMIHLYHEERPEQSRGVPRFTPAIPLLAVLRRYTLACADAAESAAKIAAYLENQSAPDEDAGYEPMEELDLPRNAILVGPEGYLLKQLKPEQPSTTYKEFKQEVINEIARCVCMPYNVAAANSARYNYASGRLDWQVYYRMIRTERQWIEENALNRIFDAWLAEARLIPGYLPGRAEFIRPRWYWPGAEHVDPVKEATGQRLRMENLVTTLADECAYMGKDWRRVLAQKKRELDELRQTGLLTPDEYDSARAAMVARVTQGKGAQNA